MNTGAKMVLAQSLVLLQACAAPDPCKSDSFFCADQEKWVENAQKLPTDRVLSLHHQLQKSYRPGDGRMLSILGARGPETVDAIILHLQRGDSMRHYDIISLIGVTKTHSTYDFCMDRYRQIKLRRAFESESRTSALFVEQLCK